MRRHMWVCSAFLGLFLLDSQQESADPFSPAKVGTLILSGVLDAHFRVLYTSINVALVSCSS
jgi:hypothetical protein